MENEESKNDTNKIQKVRLRISKLNQSKKFSTPVEDFSCSSVSDEQIEEEVIPQRNNNIQNFGQILNFNSPSSIKVIDLKQPKVRKLLMESL